MNNLFEIILAKFVYVFIFCFRDKYIDKLPKTQTVL
jgi:hypothetical protein